MVQSEEKMELENVLFTRHFSFLSVPMYHSVNLHHTFEQNYALSLFLQILNKGTGEQLYPVHQLAPGGRCCFKVFLSDLELVGPTYNVGGHQLFGAGQLGALPGGALPLLDAFWLQEHEDWGHGRCLRIGCEGT